MMLGFVSGFLVLDAAADCIYIPATLGSYAVYNEINTKLSGLLIEQMENNTDPEIKIMPRKNPLDSKLVNKEWFKKNYIQWLKDNA